MKEEKEKKERGERRKEEAMDGMKEGVGLLFNEYLTGWRIFWKETVKIVTKCGTWR